MCSVASVSLASSALVRWRSSLAQDENDLDECKPRCAQSDVDSLGTKYLIGDIALGIGIAGVASAVGVYFLQSPSEKVAVGIGPGSARLRMRF